MTTETRPHTLMLGLIFLTTIVPVACQSQAASRDDALYQKFLENHTDDQWVELTPENIKEYLKAKKADASVIATSQEAPPTEQDSQSTPVSGSSRDSTAAARHDSPSPPARSSGSAGSLEAPTGSETRTSESPGPTPPPLQPTASSTSAPALEFRDVALKDLVRLVARDAGLDVLVPDSLDQNVTVSLRNTDPLNALQSVLNANGYRIEPQENGLAVVKPIPSEDPKFETRTFTLTSTPVTAVGETLKKLLSPDGKLVINADGSSFIMLDHPDNIKLMEEYVRILDVRERQVLVEANLFEVTLENDDEIGFLLEALDISIDETTSIITSNLLPPSNDFTVGVFADKTALFGLLQALTTKRWMRLRSAPSVATLNSQTATIEVIERIPYVNATTTTTAATDGQAVTAIEQIEFEEVGVWLEVTPTIGEDSMIKMDIEPKVKELTGFFNGIPVVDSRRIKTSVMVQDGETVLIGGLIREDTIEVEEKVPLLGDIPLLGFFFTRKQNTKKKTSLFVTITPHIMTPEP